MSARTKASGKRKYKKLVQKKTRQVLNSTQNLFNISGKKISTIGYGAGLDRRSLKRK